MKCEFIENIKIFLVLFILFFFAFGCSTPNDLLKIGFGKVYLSPAGIYEDPVSKDQTPVSVEKYSREEKFAISDRVEARWCPGSGGIRKLADSIYVSAMYGEDENGPWAIITFDDTEIGFEALDHLEYPLIHQLNIQKERLVFLASHSHATPAMDPDKYQKAIFEAVNQAKESRSEVEIAAINLKLDVNIFGIQFNDKVVMAVQGEIFTQIGEKMFQPFADKNPILVSIANEYISYIPTDEERLKGGYEPGVSIVKPGSADLLVSSAHKLL